MRRTALGLVCLAASAACGDDTTALEPTLYELSDGTKIEVAEHRWEEDAEL